MRYRNVRVKFSVLLTIMLASCTVAQVSNLESLKDEDVTLHLSNYVSDDEPGIQYIVVDKNATVFSRTGGLANVAKHAPLNAGQTMAAFSMTKTLTAIAILQLVEANKVRLDDRAASYVEHPYSPAITIRQLLNHTSGIPNPIPLKWVHLVNEHSNFDEKGARQAVLQHHDEVEFMPGEEYQYNNIGYWLLGAVIEHASGMAYADYMEHRIFRPLKLTPDEIGFRIINENNHAKGYLKTWSFMGIFGRFFVDSDVIGKDESGWTHIENVYLNGPSFGGAIGTARAFSVILQDLLSEDSKLLTSRTKRQLYQQQQLNSGKEITMTLGWHIGTLEGVTYYYKEGGGAGFHSEMRIYPSSGYGSVIMANRTSFNSGNALDELDVYFVRP